MPAETQERSLIPAKGTEVTVIQNGDVYDALRVLKKVAKESADQPEIIQLAKQFDKNNLPAMMQYVYDKVCYVPDPFNTQNIKTARKTLDDGTGNCANYTTLISALLTNMNVPHHLRMVGYKRGMINHIYPVTDDGVIMDCVIGQRQDGKACETKRPGPYYNIEAPGAMSKYDVPMKINVLNGVGDCGCGGSCCDDKPTIATRGRLGATSVCEYEAKTKVLDTKKYKNLNYTNWDQSVRDIFNSGPSIQQDFNNFLNECEKKTQTGNYAGNKTQPANTNTSTTGRSNISTGNNNSNSNNATSATPNKNNLLLLGAAAIGALILLK